MEKIFNLIYLFIKYFKYFPLYKLLNYLLKFQYIMIKFKIFKNNGNR